MLKGKGVGHATTVIYWRSWYGKDYGLFRRDRTNFTRPSRPPDYRPCARSCDVYDGAEARRVSSGKRVHHGACGGHDTVSLPSVSILGESERRRTVGDWQEISPSGVVKAIRRGIGLV